MSPLSEKYIIENGIVHKYLQGKLTIEQQKEFESYLNDNPEIMDIIALDSELRSFSNQENPDTVPSLFSFLKKLIRY